MTVHNTLLPGLDDCAQWICLADGRTTELHLLDIPERALDAMFAAMRERVRIVVVMGRDGPDPFTELMRMGDDDEDLVWSTFFMALLGDVRLQHSLGPSRPVKPGPWMSVGAGTWDLEIAFWPDELSGVLAGGHDPSAALERILSYARDLKLASGAASLCVTHGCFEDPRRLMSGRDPSQTCLVLP